MSDYRYTTADYVEKSPAANDVLPPSPSAAAAALSLDAHEMARMGKEQEFRRVFNPVSTMGIVMIYLSTWQYILVSVSTGFVNGGFAGLVYEYIATIIAFGAVVLSLAEMASMAPTDGGAYHWTSEFAPRRWQKYLSYAAGWTSTLGWLAGQTSGYYIMYTLTQAMINVWLSDFAFTGWQATLVMIGYILVTVYFNTVGARALPVIEMASLVLHVGGWIFTVTAVWVMVPAESRNSVEDVFVNASNTGGWDSLGFSCLIGTVAIIFSTLGPDAAVHMAEEIQDAGRILPWTMVIGYYVNAVMGFVSLVTMLFTVGTLEEAIMADAPFVNSYAATGSKAMNFILILILWLNIGIGNITAVTTTSREFFAFARDKGMPAWRWLARVSKRYNVPINSVIVVTVGSLLLCLINIGSTTAFNIVISLNVVAFFFTYIISIGCLIRKRILGEPLPKARWSLGKFALPINIFAVGYSALVFVLASMPTSVPVTDAAEANYAPAIFVGVLLVALVAYLVQGRKIYEGPVVYVEGQRDGALGLQTSQG